jgi:hypothetical protein
VPTARRGSSSKHVHCSAVSHQFLAMCLREPEAFVLAGQLKGALGHLVDRSCRQKVATSCSSAPYPSCHCDNCRASLTLPWQILAARSIVPSDHTASSEPVFEAGSASIKRASSAWKMRGFRASRGIWPRYAVRSEFPPFFRASRRWPDRCGDWICPPRR